MEDFLLIMKMKQGDEEAFDKFIRKYYARILFYFLECKLKEIAEILQISMCKFMKVFY